MHKLWTTATLSKAAGVWQSYVRRLVQQGRIKATKHGQTWLIEDKEARKWLQTRVRKHNK